MADTAPSKKEVKDATATAAVAVKVSEPLVSVARLRAAKPAEKEQVEAFILRQGAGVKKPLSQWVTEYTTWKVSQ